MKRLGVLFLVVLLLAGCAKDGPVAPKEGRKSITVTESVEKSVKSLIPSSPKTIKQWPMALQTGSNDRYHALIEKDIREIQPLKSVSVGKGTSDSALTLAGPVVADGMAYTLDGRFGLQKTDLNTGKKIAYNRLAPDRDTAGIGLALYRNKLYAVSADGLVIGMDLNGKELWKRDLKTNLRSNPVIADGRLFLSSAHNELFALNIRNGEELWRYSGDKEVTVFFGLGTPAVWGNIVLMPTTNGRMNAFDVGTGVLVWTENMWSGRTFHPLLDMPHITASPVIENKTVYVVGNAGKTGAYRLDDGTRIFSTPIGGRETPMISGNALFLISNRGQLTALNKKDGRPFWQTDLISNDKKAVWFGPVAVNDSVIVVSSAGDIVFYEIKTGREYRRDKQDGFVKAPVIVNDMMLLLTQDGDLIRYQ